MNRKRLKPIIIGTCTVLLGMLFMYTAVSKVLEYEKFIFQMRLSPLVLMQTLAPVLAVLVPLVEFVIVGCLLLPGGYKIGFKAAFVLLGVFEVYIGGMMLSGLKLGCTCGGVVSLLSWKGHLYFNAGFMGVAWLGMRGLGNKWPLRARACPFPSSRR
ncbi:MauE/DoxX family redox-associated membrane protein [Pedobacter heparinus]|uniref:MauE/DoxX family redox-associated membrane protein n=1 Tax=Pedobacter heparinus TaxID=984 RepID=UPI002930EE99|nr:MauE/DoxX family redox-associated membrane protein [Pedobacter heparinus]